MTGSDEREEGVPADGAATNQEPSKDAEPSKEQRRAARRAAKALKRQAKTAQRAAKQAKKAAKAEAAASAKAARATAKAAAMAAKADAKARKAAKADARAAKKAAKGAGRAGSLNRPASPAVAAASALLEEAADLMRQADARVANRMPEREANLEAAPEPEAEPQPDEAAEAEADAEPQPDGAAQAEADAEPEAEPQPDGAAQAEADAEPEAEPQPDDAGEPQPDGAAEAEAEPESQPEADTEREAEAEGPVGAKTEPKTTAEAEPQPDGAAEAEAGAEPGPAAQPEALAQPDAEAQAEQDAQPAEPEPQPEFASEPGEPQAVETPAVGTQPAEPEGSAETQPETAAENGGEPEPEAAPDTGPEAEAAPEAAADNEGEPEPEAAPEAAAEMVPEAEAAPETAAENEGEPESAAEPEAAPEAAAEMVPEAEAAPESDVEPDAQAGSDLGSPPQQFAQIAAGEAPVALLASEASEAPSGAFQPFDHARSHVAASIDVGATSVHLLVGTVDGHRVAPLLDESEFLGLGDRVAAEGYLGDELRAPLIFALERYVNRARELGATTITIVGTDPLRRAADAAAVVREVEARLGVPLHVLDHAEEGLLTLIGATGGSPVNGELLLVDIGGGSSEFVTVGLDGVAHALGLPLGAARLTRDLVRSDPPSLPEIEALRREVARVIVDAPEASPAEIVAVGGTASNLLRLLPATAVDRSLTRRRIAVALAMLTVERSREAATRHLIRPERARILPAGAIIVDAVLERYRADRLRVSEAGIREGAILAAHHGGAAWRDRLTPLALGWAEARPGV